jgi:thiamine-phosphate pyrophosphorylase
MSNNAALIFCFKLRRLYFSIERMGMQRTYNPSVYFVVDPACCGGRDVIHVVEQAIAGGVTLLQYRDKVNSKEVVYHNACVIRDVAFDCQIPFLVNDYANIAELVCADGVHLGQGDMSAAEARALLGPSAIIGVTAFTEAQIAAVDPDVVDYIGLGPFFPTQTDKGKPVLGAERFAALAALSPVPVIGIGGITPLNAADVIRSGAYGVAMMRAVSEAEDVRLAASAFLDAVGLAKAA